MSTIPYSLLRLFGLAFNEELFIFTGTKVERADDLGLPPRTVVIRRDLFNEEEEDMYDSLYSDSQRKFSTYVEQGTVLNNYANIFELLTSEFLF